MGVDIAGLGLLALARKEGADFRRVATIGRQGLGLRNEEIAEFFSKRGRTDLAAAWALRPQERYCEPLLSEAFGAGEVCSFDASDYEQANVVHDMNAPIDAREPFSVVADFGTLEHVLNVAVAFDNVARLCATGGHILHVLPGNNFSGHGFYQYSPEFFFQVYAPERGYEGTRVFAAVTGDDAHWYEIAAPSAVGRRVNLTSRRPFNMLVLTRKTSEAPPLTTRPVQQSDYVALWQESEGKREQVARTWLGERVRTLTAGLRSERKAARLDVRRRRSDVSRQRVLDLTPSF